MLDAKAVAPADLAEVREMLAKLPEHGARVQMRPGVQAGELIRLPPVGGRTQDVIPLFALDDSVAIIPGESNSASCTDLQALAEKQRAYIEALEKELATCQESSGVTP